MELVLMFYLTVLTVTNCFGADFPDLDGLKFRVSDGFLSKKSLADGWAIQLDTNLKTNAKTARLILSRNSKTYILPIVFKNTPEQFPDSLIPSSITFNLNNQTVNWKLHIATCLNVYILTRMKKVIRQEIQVRDGELHLPLSVLPKNASFKVCVTRFLQHRNIQYRFQCLNSEHNMSQKTLPMSTRQWFVRYQNDDGVWKYISTNLNKKLLLNQDVSEQHMAHFTTNYDQTIYKNADSNILKYVLVGVLIVIILVLCSALMFSMKKKSDSLNRYIRKQFFIKKSNVNNRSSLDENLRIDNSGEGSIIPLNCFIERFQTMKENQFQDLKLEYKKLVNQSMRDKECQFKISEVLRQLTNFAELLTPQMLQIDQVRLKVEPSEFCNSNLDAVFVLGSAGSSGQRLLQYIVCQEPMEYALDDFYRMIIEHNVRFIVSICRQSKYCVTFKFDEHTKESEFDEYNRDFRVSLVKEEVDDILQERIIRISRTGQLHERTQTTRLRKGPHDVVQLQMKMSSSSTSTDNLIGHDRLFCRLHELNGIDSGDRNIEDVGPILIHSRNSNLDQCAVIICIDRIIGQLKSGAHEVDIYKSMLDVSRHRNLTLQQEVQYLYAYEFVDYFLKKATKMMTKKKRTNPSGRSKVVSAVG